MEGMAARRSRGSSGEGSLRRWRQLEDGSYAMTTVKYPWPGQGVAAVVAAAVACGTSSGGGDGDNGWTPPPAFHDVGSFGMEICMIRMI